MTKVKIRNLKINTIIGVNSWERENKQQVFLTLKIYFDDSKASKSDSINDTIDYDLLSKNIVSGVESTEFYLIEALSEYILGIIKENPNILKAKICLTKPEALQKADSVSIRKLFDRSKK